MADGLFVHDVTVPGCVVLSLCGELDVSTSPALRAQLAESAARGQCRLVVDLTALSFIDAHGWGCCSPLRSRCTSAVGGSA